MKSIKTITEPARGDRAKQVCAMTIQKTDPLKFLCIDLFCGAGGVTSGLEKARDEQGRKLAKVFACVNHDPLAIESHEYNHPHALHLSEDIRHADIRQIFERMEEEKRLHPQAKILLWASAECTNYSVAKGGLPRDADSRTLPNAIIRYIKTLRPDFIAIENVKEFMSWGDLDANGRPVSKDKGRDYIRWCNRIQHLGYDFNWRLLNAADFGAHTDRVRYFGIFARPELSIKFPEPTHAKKPRPGMFGQLSKWKPVREVLDLHEEGSSIFDRKKPLVDRTLARILAGLERYVANGEKEWLVKYFNKGNGDVNVGRSLNDPSPTICVQVRMCLAQVERADRWLVKYNNNGAEPNKGASLDNPAPTITTRAAVALARVNFLQTYYGNGNTSGTDQPAPTVTTRDRLSLVSAQWLDKYYGSGDRNHQDISRPAGTITTNPKFALVTTDQFITPTNYDAAPHDLEQPLGTITANRKWHYLVSPVAAMGEGGEVYIRIDESDSPTMRKIKQFMAAYGIVDIKMRMLFVRELKRITGFQEDYYLAGNQSDQKKFIGNAVPPVIPQHMIEALNEVLEYQVAHLAV